MKGRTKNRVRLFIAGLAACLLTTDNAHGAKISIAWDRPTDSNDVVGYKVYYGTQSRTYSGSVDVGNMTTCTLDQLDPKTTYYFAITAYNQSSNESAFSAELAWDNEPPTISGPDELTLACSSSEIVLMPSLGEHFAINDDVSGKTITVRQSPCRNMLVKLPRPAFIEATDGAGNITRRAIQLTPQTTKKTDSEEGSWRHQSISIASSNGTSVVSFHSNVSDEVSSIGTEKRFLTLEWSSDVRGQKWKPVPGYENIPVAAREIRTYQLPPHIRFACFRLRVNMP